MEVQVEKPTTDRAIPISDSLVDPRKQTRFERRREGVRHRKNPKNPTIRSLNRPARRPAATPCQLIRAFISRTASRKPTSTARETIEWPIFSSPMPSKRATSTTLR